MFLAKHASWMNYSTKGIFSRPFGISCALLPDVSCWWPSQVRVLELEYTMVASHFLAKWHYQKFYCTFSSGLDIERKDPGTDSKFFSKSTGLRYTFSPIPDILLLNNIALDVSFAYLTMSLSAHMLDDQWFPSEHSIASLLFLDFFPSWLRGISHR